MSENRTNRVRKKVDKDFFENISNPVSTKGRKPGQVYKKLKPSKNNSISDKNCKVDNESNDNILWEPPSVVLSLRDKANQINVSSDQLVCSGGEGGFRMIRATQGVHAGSYYYEVEILAPAPACEDAHVRLGWSTREGHLQAFTGYDKSSYGIRDINGNVN